MSEKSINSISIFREWHDRDHMPAAYASDLGRTKNFLELEQIIFQIRTRTRIKTSNFSNWNVRQTLINLYKV